jgi:hypothetical protein
VVDNLEDFVAALNSSRFDIILADYLLPTCTGLQALEKALSTAHDTPFVLLSGMLGEDAAIASLTNGATDYVLKQRVERLVPAVRRALQEAKERARRKAAEQELKRREEYYRKLTEHSSDALGILNARGKIVYASPSVKRILGYAPDEVHNKDVFALVHPEDLPAVRRTFRQAMRIRELRVTQELRCQRADGSWCDLEVVGQNYLHDPRMAGFVINAREITERKQMEVRLRQTQKMEVIGQLASGIAHDLNNILTPIVLTVPLLRSALSRADLDKASEAIEVSANRAAAIVKQLLWFARGLESKRVLLDPQDIVKEVRQFIAETFPKHVRLETRAALGVRRIMADPTHLHQVLLNLCVNARDAMPNGGTLLISCRNTEVTLDDLARYPEASPGHYVVLEVKDTGAGIPQEIASRIFEPFFSTKEPGKGTGLGLSVVDSIVKGYSGFINFESDAGKGTTFQVHLPAQADSCAERVEAEEVRSRPRGTGETVLVVDDEDSVRHVLERMLESYGYRVLTASDGEHALATYVQRRNEIAIVLTDVIMPVLDGVATVQALKRINPEVKIIAATGFEEHVDVETLRSIGVERILSKPYTVETILQELRSMLGPVPSANP